MSRVALISSTLKPEEVDALADSIIGVFAKGRKVHRCDVTREQAVAFAIALDEALSIYKELSRQAAAELGEYPKQLRALAKAIPPIKKAITELGPDARDRICLAQWEVFRPKKFPTFNYGERFLLWLEFINAAVERDLKGIGSAPSSRRPDLAMQSLIKDLADRFEQLFGIAPSYSRNGTFYQVLEVAAEQLTGFPHISQNRLKLALPPPAPCTNDQAP